MHELKIIQDIFPMIEAVAQKNHLKSINRVVLQVGVLRQVVSEFLRFAFSEVAKNTIAENAELVIEPIPVTVCCRFCKLESKPVANIYICSGCGSSNLEVLTGKEIILATINGS